MDVGNIEDDEDIYYVDNIDETVTMSIFDTGSCEIN